MLEANDVSFYYGDKPSLENVTFSVGRGEFFGIIGPNGSGKTTLLKCISGILKPRSGVIRLNGLNIYVLSEKEIAKNIAVVPQSSNIDFDFSAQEIVMMGRNPYLSRFSMEDQKDYKVVEEAMEFTSTKHLAQRLVRSLSGGELQRIIIARALAQQPKLLLLDEPTAHLDINHQLEIMDLIRKLNKGSDMSVVSVFHELNLASQYCDRLALLDHGRVSSLGIPDHVLTRENIRRAYHINVLVKKHPLSSSLYVIPFSHTDRSLTPNKANVHIICGGGTGAPLMKALTDAGCYVTAGVLNVLDSDHEAAQSLGITVVEEAPFSQITDETYRKNLKFIEASKAVVIANAPFGKGNIRNLNAAKATIDRHIPVILVESTPFNERNFAGEEGNVLYDYIRERATVVQEPRNVLNVIQSLTKGY